MTLELRDPGQPGESLAEVIRAFAAALRSDIENVHDGTATRIHDIRVGTKKLRALLRLAAEALPEAVPPALRLRAIRQAFSGTRDADVMRQRIAELFSDEAGSVLRELALDAPETEPVLPRENALQLCAELETLLGGIDFSKVTRDGLLENATRSHRRARKLMRRCREIPEDDVLMHEWRKRTKDACYHAMTLGAAKTMQKRTQPLDALAEKLGEYHDLSVLGARAEGHDLIFSVVEKRKRRVRRECFKAAEKIFRRKPSALRKKLAGQIKE
jgi:CHAD domain-containing protein